MKVNNKRLRENAIIEAAASIIVERRNRGARKLRESEMTLEQKDAAFKKYIAEHPEVESGLDEFNKELYRKEKEETARKFHNLYRGIDTSQSSLIEKYPSSDDWYAPFLPTTQDVIDKLNFKGESKFFEMAAQVIIDTIKLELCEGVTTDSISELIEQIPDSFYDTEFCGLESTYSHGSTVNAIPVNAVILAAMYPIESFERFMELLKQYEEEEEIEWPEFTDEVYENFPGYAFIGAWGIEDSEKVLNWIKHPTPFCVSMICGD